MQVIDIIACHDRLSFLLFQAFPLFPPGRRISVLKGAAFIPAYPLDTAISLSPLLPNFSCSGCPALRWRLASVA